MFRINKVTLVCAKFGKDLFSISKVTCRKTKWPWFFGLPCIVAKRCVLPKNSLKKQIGNGLKGIEWSCDR